MSEPIIYDFGKGRKLHTYLVAGEFDNEILMKGKGGLITYTAKSFKEAEKIAKSIGLKRLKFGIRTSLINENPEPCRIIDINTKQYLV